MAKVTKAKEYAVTLPNKAGTMASLLRGLADAGVNVLALTGKCKGRKGKLRFVPSNAAKTDRVLKKAKIEADRNDVLLVELADKPGAGARVAEGLAEAGVNLEAAYAAAAGGKALLVLKMENPAAAAKAIRKVK